MSKEVSPSRQVAIKFWNAAFKLLKEAGGSMHRTELMDQISNHVEFNEWESELNEKSNAKRWQIISSFYTIPISKAGYFIKNKGLWTLTPEGETAIKKGAAQMIDEAVKIYRKWDREREKASVPESDDELTEVENVDLDIEEFEEKAMDGIRTFLKAKNAYEFQDTVAALLNAMGYHISYIAPPGRDGGIDIIAYNDPLGTVPPRIVVQVKHRPESNISSDEIQKLVGTMRRDSDVGIFVTSGEMSNPAKTEARQSGKHVELIGFTRFIELWIKYYDKMSDENKSMLPLQPIYFLREVEN